VLQFGAPLKSRRRSARRLSAQRSVDRRMSRCRAAPGSGRGAGRGRPRAGRGAPAAGGRGAADCLSCAPLEAPTARTVVDPKALRALLARVSEQGYALDLGEHEPDVRCVAVPVRNHSGAVIAAISVSGPAQRIEPMLSEGLVAEVVRVGRAVSGLLGYVRPDTAQEVPRSKSRSRTV